MMFGDSSRMQDVYLSPRVIQISIPRRAKPTLSAALSWVSALWQALSKSAWRRFLGLQEHVALEIVAQGPNIRLQLWCPFKALADALTRQFQSYFAHVTIQDADMALPVAEHSASAELVLHRSRDRPLRRIRGSDADPLAGLLGSMSGLSWNEAAVVQLLVRPDMGADLETLTFQAIIRVLATGPHLAQARSRLRSLVAAFGPFGEANTFRPTNMRLDDARRFDDLQERHWPLFRQRPFVLTAEELAGLYHLPAPTEMHSALPLAHGATRLPARPSGQGRTVVVGQVQANGRMHDAGVAPRSLLRHMAMFGATGTGKSTLLLNMSVNLIELGLGMTLLDPHGTLVDAVLESVPVKYLPKVSVIRFADIDYPVAFNPLQARAGLEFLVVDELVEICRRIDDRESWGPVLDTVLRHAAYATLETGGTLIEMARLLDDDLFRERMLPQIGNVETRRFMAQLGEYRRGTREQKVASTLNRLQRFLGTPFIRNVVGQTQSSIDIREAMDAGRVLLFDLSGIGVTNAQFLGSLLTLQYRQVALSRRRWQRPHFLIMDECSWFISRTVGEMLDQVRKFGLGVILSAQRLGQIRPQDTREALFSDVANLVTFRLGDQQEARYLAQHLDTPGLSGDDVRALGRYEVYAQLLADGEKQPAFWACTPPPPPKLGSLDRMEQVMWQSRKRYAMPREYVEARIANRGNGEMHHEPEIRAKNTALHRPG